MANDFQLGQLGQYVTVNTAANSVTVNSNITVANIGGPLTVTGNLAVTSVLSVSNNLVTPFTGMKNRIINGNFTINQRNTGSQTLNSGGVWPADRFFSQASGLTANSVLATGAGLVDSDDYVAFNVSTQNSDNNYYCSITQRVEGYNAQGLGFWDTGNCTLSFWVYSNKTGNYTVEISSGFRGTSYQFGFITLPYTINQANTWEKKTIVVPSAFGQTINWQKTNLNALEITFLLGVGSSATGLRSDALNTWVTLASSSGYFLGSGLGNNNSWGKSNTDIFRLTAVQLEQGTVATPFERRSYGQELALCQRYYEGPILCQCGGYVVSGVGMYNSINFAVIKRTTPTLTSSNLGLVGSATGASQSNFGAIGINYAISNGSTGGSIGSFYSYASAEL